MALTDLIQIVDSEDNPIGNETMARARQEGLIHRIARVMVQDSSGRLLLQMRAANKPLWPNCWDNSAAGHVDADEGYLVAAKRELFEELGIRADQLEEIGTYFQDITYRDDTLKRFNRVYRFVTDAAPDQVKNNEVAGVKWFTMEEVKGLIADHPDQVSDGLVDVINRYY